MLITQSKTYENKKLGKYNDFDVESDTLLPADVFSNFINMS